MIPLFSCCSVLCFRVLRLSCPRVIYFPCPLAYMFILSSYSLVPVLYYSSVLLFSCPSFVVSSCLLVISTRPLHGTNLGCNYARPIVLFFFTSLCWCPSLILPSYYMFLVVLFILSSYSLWSNVKCGAKAPHLTLLSCCLAFVILYLCFLVFRLSVSVSFFFLVLVLYVSFVLLLLFLYCPLIPLSLCYLVRMFSCSIVLHLSCPLVLLFLLVINTRPLHGARMDAILHAGGPDLQTYPKSFKNKLQQNPRTYKAPPET